MAYALQSLVKILEEDQHKHHLSSASRSEIDLFIENARSLRDLVDNISFEISDDLGSRIRDAAHYAEDDIERHIVELLSPNEEEEEEEEYELELSDVMEEFDSIKEQIIILLNSEKVQCDLEQSPTVAISSRPYPNSVWGFDRDINRLKNQLVSEQKSQLQVIPIVGIAGSGKTKLADYLYSFESGHVDICAWTTISQEFNLRYSLLALLDCLIDVTAQMRWENDNTQLGEYLRATLANKRYLVVVDDIWNTNSWDELRKFFPDNNNGSRVILTTREWNLAEYAKTSFYPHQMLPLSNGNSWHLLCEKVFGGVHYCPLDLVETGMKIARNCKGHPLAIVTIAGGLPASGNMLLDAWQRVESQQLHSKEKTEKVDSTNEDKMSKIHIGPSLKGFVEFFAKNGIRLMSRVMHGESKLHIIPIVGVAKSTGKTILARLIYDRALRGQHFDIHAWVSIIETQTMGRKQGNVLATLQDLLNSLNEHGMPKVNDGEIGVRVHKTLKNRRYLIVVDDVRDGQTWEAISQFFPDECNGSRVIFTAREWSVYHGINPFRLNLYWEFLLGRVSTLLPTLEMKLEFWRFVEEEYASLVTLNSGDLYLDFVSMSYNTLPYHLKPCFLYLGVVTKDYKIQTKCIIQMWIAEGFIRPVAEKSLEDTAEMYLESLISRNLVFACGTDYDGRVIAFRIHDVLWKFCQKRALDEKLLWFKDLNCENIEVDVEIVRRVSVNPKCVPSNDEDEVFSVARSFLCIGSASLDLAPMFLALRLLRVLCVIGVEFNQFPQQLLQLINLSGPTSDLTESTSHTPECEMPIQKLEKSSAGEDLYQMEHENSNVIMAEEAEAKGRIAFSEGNYMDAIKNYSDAINLSPSDHHLLYLSRSEAHISLGQISEALLDAQKIVQLKPDFSTGYIQLGETYSNLNNHKDSISAYEKALEIDPDNDNFKSYISHVKGKATFSSGSFVEAIQHWTNAINLYPSNHIYHHNRSLTHTYLNERFKSLSDAQKTVQLNPYWSTGYIRLGEAYCDLNNYKDAISSYEKALEIDPGNDIVKSCISDQKGMVASSSGSFVEAIQHWMDAINLYPLNHIYHYNRSVTHACLNKFSKSLSDAQNAVQLEPYWSTGYIQLGKAYSNLNNYKDAISAYGKALEIDPDNDIVKSYISHQKGMSTFSSGSFVEAIQHWTYAINLYPSNHFYYYKRSLAHACLNEFSKSLSDAQKIRQLNPYWSTGYIRLGEAYSNLNNHKDAISTYEKALEIEPNNDIFKSKIAHQKGMAAFSFGSFVEAIQHWTDAINLHPLNYNYYYNRSVAHASLNQFSESLSDAQKTVQINPYWSTGYILLGDAYSYLNNYKDVVSAYEKALEIDPGNDIFKSNILYAKGMVALSSRSFVEAIQHLTDAINLHPSHHIYYYKRSLAHAHLNQFSKSLSDAQKTVQLNPYWSTGYSQLGDAYYNLKKYKDAVSAYKKGFEIDPSNNDLKGWILNARGKEACKTGNFIDAIQHYTDAIKLDPSEYIYYSNRSEAHASLNHFSKAMSDAQKTVQLNPYWSKGYSQLGDAYFNLKKYKDGVSAYEKGFEIDPSNNDLKCWLLNARGMEACKSGNFIDAIQHYTDAINLYPSYYIYYYDRSEAYASLNHLSKAMSDAQEVVQLQPNWSEGYSSLGDIYLGLQIYKDAISAYEKALKIRPTNTKLKSSLTIAKAAWAIRKRKDV